MRRGSVYREQRLCVRILKFRNDAKHKTNYCFLPTLLPLPPWSWSAAASPITNQKGVENENSMLNAPLFKY